uniref:CD80-like immunoglobulin C2-set domain-containing protein n=1 Tax=Phlebotomus papatasi TaxID=29031 RepID=A0A1B0GM27_PHLPP
MKTLAALPRHDPIITGINQRYEDGDFLLGNCTSDMSSPPAMLSWYINDEKAPPEYLQPLHETTIESDGFQLRFRSLELRFHIDKARHENVRNTMRLKCLARVEQIPTATRESSIAVYIASPDDLTNQKLINYWTNSNSGHRKFTAMLFVTLTTLI